MGDRAEWNIKATHDFQYMPTDESLRKEREAAVEKILPIFDYQADLGTIIVARIGRAFNAVLARDTSPPLPEQVLDPKTGRIEEVPPKKTRSRSKSKDEGATWKKVKQLTSNSPRNHTYARRPVNAHPGFYAIWADGHGRKPSQSSLYFCDKQGNVRLLPREMTGDFAEPRLLESDR